MNGKKFELGKTPFIRKADLTQENTSGFMRDFLIALLPLVLFAWVKNGILPFANGDTNFWGMLYPLLLPVFGFVFSTLLEGLWYFLIVKKGPVFDTLKLTYPGIPGLLLGMIVPLSTPIWVLLMGTLFATVIGKLIFGGFGHNIFNPALVGFLFLTTYSYSGLMLGKTGFGSSGYLNPTEAIKIISGATPMQAFSVDRFAGVTKLIEEYGLLKMFIGLTPGSLAETSALLCLVALVFLLVRKVIDWRIPVIYIGTVFVLTYIIGAFNGYAGTLNYALFGILNGGLMFGAVFMATEPVTSPRNPNGKIIYALALGVLTVVFRFASKYPEGVAISILTLNMFTAIIERFSAKVRVEPNKRKVALSYSLVGLLLLAIASFPIVSSIPKSVSFEYVSSTQDYKTFNFEYTFKAKDGEFVVVTDQSYKIVSISNDAYDTEAAKTTLLEIINENKISNYVVSANEGLDYLEVVVNTKGYSSTPVTSTIKYDNNFVITDFSVEYSETYDNDHNEDWSTGNGHPKDVIPGRIIANQDNLDAVEVVTGATVTSRAIIKAVEVAKGYVDYLSTITDLTFIGKSQDLATLNFVYVFRNASGKVLVETNTSYEIISTIDDSLKASVQPIINANKFVEYFESATEDTIVVITKGFKGNVKSTFKFDEELKFVEVNVEYDESYADDDNHDWVPANGHPNQKLPADIISKQGNLDDVQVVSGASVTSRAIIRAAKMALDYLSVLEGNNE